MPQYFTPNPLISIIMTTRNCENFIEENINSVIAQTHKHWELVITNNQSDDATLAIIKRYAAIDKRIHVFTNPGLPEIIPGLQYAFSNSKGELITRMDSDDIMPPDKLESMFNKLQQYGNGHIVTGGIAHFSKGELGEGFKRYDSWINQLMHSETNFLEIYRECVIPSSCWMVYRDDFIRCGGFGRNVYPEDYDLCFRFYKQGLKIITLKQVVHHWRDHHNRVSRVDPRYQNQLYYDLKLYYFFQLDFDPSQTIVLWGGGSKGKLLANKLIKLGISFRWVCNNEKKIGKDIYSIRMESTTILDDTNFFQIMIAVSSREKDEITSFLESKKHNSYWFC